MKTKTQLLNAIINFSRNHGFTIPQDLDHMSMHELMDMHDSMVETLGSEQAPSENYDDVLARRDEAQAKKDQAFSKLNNLIQHSQGQGWSVSPANQQWFSTYSKELQDAEKDLKKYDTQLKGKLGQQKGNVKSRQETFNRLQQEKQSAQQAVPTDNPVLQAMNNLQEAVHNPSSSAHQTLSSFSQERGYPNTSSAHYREHGQHPQDSYMDDTDNESDITGLTGRPARGSTTEFISPDNDYPRITNEAPPAQPPQRINLQSLPNIPATHVQGMAPLHTQQAEKGLLETAIEHHNRPLTPPSKLLSVAPLSSEERYAQSINQEQLNPWLHHNKREEEKIYNRANEAPDARAEEVAEPYLQQIRQNPYKLMKEMQGEEGKNYLQSLSEEMDENFLNNILPQAKRGLTIPGLRHHGRQNEVTEKLVKEFGKGKTRALTKAALEERNLGLQAAHKHQGLQLQGANAAAANAGQNFGEHTKKTSLMAEQRNKDLAQKEKYLAGLAGYGVKKRALHQELLDNAKKEEAKARAEPGERIQELGATIRGLAHQSRASAEAAQPIPHPSLHQPNMHQQIGSGLMGMGLGRFNQGFKKGGVVKKAKGGEVLQEALTNAVVHKDDPLYELRRLMDRQRANDVYETKIGRRRFKSGGAVDPIMQGAHEARLFNAQKKYRDVLHRHQNPEQSHALKSMLDDFMTGVSTVGGDRGLGGVAKVYNSIREKHAAEKNARDKTELGAHEAEYGLEKDISKEVAQLRQSALQQAQHEEMVRHHKAHESLMNEKQAATAPMKLTGADNQILKEASHQVRLTPSLITKLDRVKELADKIDTGGITSTGMLSDPRIQSVIGKGEQADYDEFDKLTTQIATEAAAMFGARAGARIAQLMQQAKPNRGMANKGIHNVIDQMKQILEEENARDVEILSSAQRGVSPTQALAEHASHRVSSHEPSPTGSQMQMVEVISPDGRKGKIPAQNLEKALAQGYKHAA